MSAEPVARESGNQAAGEMDYKQVDKPLPKVGYSFKEAQQITGLGRTTLSKAIDDEKLKCFRVGRRVLFSLKHLEDFMRLNESGSDEGASPRRKARVSNGRQD